MMLRHYCFMAIAISALLPSGVHAANIENGRNIAMRECAPCHIVAPFQRNEVADAPPFEVIGRKNGFDAGMLALALLTPHPKMNFRPRKQDVDDIAAYIASLAE